VKTKVAQRFNFDKKKTYKRNIKKIGMVLDKQEFGQMKTLKIKVFPGKKTSNEPKYNI